MTERSLTLLFGKTGQVVYLDCPEGRPSAVESVQCWSEDQSDEDAEEAAFGAPTIDTVNTTFDADSGVSETDQTKCNLTATTNIVAGREYIIANSYGQTERPIVERIESGVAVYVRNQLVHDYASGDSFKSPRVSATIDSDWIDDVDNLSNPLSPYPQYRAVFNYTVDGLARRAAVYFDVVRYPYTHTVTPADVDRGARGWLARLHPDDVAGAGTAKIDEAFRQVKLDLWERTRVAYAQRNSEFVNELIRLKSVLLVHEDAFLQGGIGREQLEYATQRYWSRLENLFPLVREQIAADGSSALNPNRTLFRR